MTYVKPTVKNPNIIVGDFTYLSDVDFGSHATYYYAVSIYPFYILEGWNQEVSALKFMLLKGNAVVENDVWIG